MSLHETFAGNGISPIGNRRDVLPIQRGLQGKQSHMDEVADFFELRTLASTSDQAHQASDVVDHPNATAATKLVRSVDQSIANHEHLELGNLSFTMPIIVKAVWKNCNKGFTGLGWWRVPEDQESGKDQNF